MGEHLPEEMPRLGRGCPHGWIDGRLRPFKADGHGIEGEGAEEVAAHALLHLDEGAGGSIDPVDGEALGEAVKVGGEIEVADEGGSSCNDEEKVFNEAAEGTEEFDGLLLAVGAGAIALSGMEELGVVGFPQGCAEQDQRVLAAGEVGAQVDGEGAADGSFREAGSEGAVVCLSSGRRWARKDSRSGLGMAPRR